MELIYCSLAFTGFASFFDGKLMKAIMELASFVFLLFLGLRFLTVKSLETKSIMGAKTYRQIASALGVHDWT